MNIKISKELLSEVLQEDFSSNKIEFEQINLTNSSRIVIDDWLAINIYELAYKCKVWAYKEGYLIGLNARQGVTLIDTETNRVLRYITIDNLEQTIRFELNLCQWILENKDKND